MPAPQVPDIAQGNQEFSAKMRAFHAWEAGELWNALTAFFDGRLLSTSTTSTSTITVDTAATKTFTVESDKGFLPGMFLVAANTGATGNFIAGQVVSYSGTTLVMSNTSRGGTGSFSAWTISQSVAGGGAGLGSNTFNGVQNFSQGNDIASAATINLTTATGNVVTVTGTVATSAVTLGVGMTRLVRAAAAWPLTYNATTNNITGGISTVLAPGDHVFYHNISGVVYGLIIKANGQAVAPLVQNYFSGGIMSTAGASTTMTVGAWFGADSTNAVMMNLASINKTTSAWAVGSGNGGLDTGTIANNTWYHFYAIRRPDTGVVDAIFSTSAVSPTLPTNYTQFRYIGSGRTNGSAQWTLFAQFGNQVFWDAAVIDVDVANPGTAAVSRTVTTPLGIKTLAILTVGVGGFSSSNLNAVVSSLDVSDQAPQAGGTAALTGFSTIGAATSNLAWEFSEQKVMTNTASQVRTRLSISVTNDRLGIITRGWEYIR